MISANVDFRGFPIFGNDKLREKIYGSPYTREMLEQLYGKILNPEQIKDLANSNGETESNKWLQFYEDNSPGIAFLSGRGWKTWVVAYEPKRLHPYQFAKITEMQWLPATPQSLYAAGLTPEAQPVNQEPKERMRLSKSAMWQTMPKSGAEDIWMRSLPSVNDDETTQRQKWADAVKLSSARR